MVLQDFTFSLKLKNCRTKLKTPLKITKLLLKKTQLCGVPSTACKLNPTEVEPHKIFREDHIAILSLN
jgi:hypothetical protein